MNATTRRAVERAQKAIDQLIQNCQKDGRLYEQAPRAVAHVNRTSKWFLNAVADLQRTLNQPIPKEVKQ
jgi:hypothetical protein